MSFSHFATVDNAAHNIPNILSNIPFCLPAGMSAETFLAKYWQKKPLLIRQGLPNIRGMFEPEDIMALASEDEVTARLIWQAENNNLSNNCEDNSFHESQHHDTSQSPKWSIKQSPLTEVDFAQLPRLWTVLVQNLEQWSPELGQLWQAFAFIPQWQRDDIMVSYAPVGGSVGRHYDEYDVFLVQGYGRRRWQLGQYCDDQTAFIEGEPIRLLDDMGEIVFDEILEAGDVLYVPPKLSHYGIAQDDCLTFSFGFRRPNILQIVDSLAEVATSHPQLSVPLMLPQSLQPTGELSNDSIATIRKQLIDVLNSVEGNEWLTQAVAELVSKRQYDLLLPDELLDVSTVREALNDGALLKWDANHRLIYTMQNDTLQIYIDGQQLESVDIEVGTCLMCLANGEALGNDALASVLDVTLEEWLENGWVWLED